MQQSVFVKSLVYRCITNQVAVTCRRGDVVPDGCRRLPCLATVFGDVVPALPCVPYAHEDAAVNELGDFSLVTAH